MKKEVAIATELTDRSIRNLALIQNLSGEAIVPLQNDFIDRLVLDVIYD